MADNITTYEPDNSIKQGYLGIFKEMAQEVREGKWLTRQLFVRDFKAMYKQSFLGLIWALIVPLVTLGTFMLLNSAGIFDVGDITVPYAVFALLGIAFWQLLTFYGQKLSLVFPWGLTSHSLATRAWNYWNCFIHCSFLPIKIKVEKLFHML